MNNHQYHQTLISLDDEDKACCRIEYFPMANWQDPTGLEEILQPLVYENPMNDQLEDKTIDLYQDYTYSKRSPTSAILCEVDEDQDYQREVPVSTQGLWGNAFGW
jgi:hypothetical protein